MKVVLALPSIRLSFYSIPRCPIATSLLARDMWPRKKAKEPSLMIVLPGKCFLFQPAQYPPAQPPFALCGIFVLLSCLDKHPPIQFNIGTLALFSSTDGVCPQQTIAQERHYCSSTVRGGLILQLILSKEWRWWMMVCGGIGWMTRSVGARLSSVELNWLHTSITCPVMIRCSLVHSPIQLLCISSELQRQCQGSALSGRAPD